MKERSWNLDEGYSYSIFFNLAANGVAHFPDELVRDHKHQNVGVLGRLHQVWHSQLRRKKTSWDMWPTWGLKPLQERTWFWDKPVSYHVRWQFVPREVLHVFMLGVDDFSQFTPVHHLLKHPHFHSLVKFGVFGRVVSHYFGNGRTPAESEVRVQQQLCIKYDESPTFLDMPTTSANDSTLR